MYTTFVARRVIFDMKRKGPTKQPVALASLAGIFNKVFVTNQQKCATSVYTVHMIEVANLLGSAPPLIGPSPFSTSARPDDIAEPWHKPSYHSSIYSKSLGNNPWLF